MMFEIMPEIMQHIEFSSNYVTSIEFCFQIFVIKLNGCSKAGDNGVDGSYGEIWMMTHR